ncbi:hypothetical protein C8J56DRAFT_1048859 [Mycena floridula]|nr:hypothetical protein C8J56DRAFT_1048859 [Mycena floridula]
MTPQVAHRTDKFTDGSAYDGIGFCIITFRQDELSGEKPRSHFCRFVQIPGMESWSIIQIILRIEPLETTGYKRSFAKSKAVTTTGHHFVPTNPNHRLLLVTVETLD